MSPVAQDDEIATDPDFIGVLAMTEGGLVITPLFCLCEEPSGDEAISPLSHGIAALRYDRDSQ